MLAHAVSPKVNPQSATDDITHAKMHAVKSFFIPAVCGKGGKLYYCNYNSEQHVNQKGVDDKIAQ